MSGPDNKRSAHWFVPLDKAVAIIGEGHSEGLFPVYPEYLIKEVVQYRKDLQTLMDYNSNQLPIVFSQVMRLILSKNPIFSLRLWEFALSSGDCWESS